MEHAKQTRNLEKTRSIILNATFLEVFKQGFQGASIDNIIKKTKLTKGALYHQFPTKLDLGYALVDEVIKPMIIKRWITPLEQFENPLEGILTQMQKLIGDINPRHLRLGCPLNNLVQEMAPIDAGFRKRLQAALHLWINETELQLQRAKENGYLKAKVDTREAAHFIVMAHEGFFGIIKGLDKDSAFTGMFNSLKSYFQMISA